MVKSSFLLLWVLMHTHLREIWIRTLYWQTILSSHRTGELYGRWNACKGMGGNHSAVEPSQRARPLQWVRSAFAPLYTLRRIRAALISSLPVTLFFHLHSSNLEYIV